MKALRRYEGLVNSILQLPSSVFSRSSWLLICANSVAANAVELSCGLWWSRSIIVRASSVRSLVSSLCA